MTRARDKDTPRAAAKRPWAPTLALALGAVVAVLLVAVVVGRLYGLSSGTRRAKTETGSAAGSAGETSASGRTGYAAGPSVTLWVTRDFGSRVLVDRSAPLAGTSTVIDVLSANATVTTAYGGGFIQSIDGLKSTFGLGSSAPQDWLYYVNGMIGTSGGGEYRLAPTDRVWWDFHRWDFAVSIPAVVGQYPEPFLSGYRRSTFPTTIAYAPGFAREAGALAGALREVGVGRIRLAALTPTHAPPRVAQLVLVGPWAELVRLAWVRDASKNARTSGLFARFDAGGTQALDAAGRVHARPSGAGAVMATARADAPGAVCWLITGSDKGDVSRAASVVTERPRALARAFGVLVGRDGSVETLPLEAVPR